MATATLDPVIQEFIETKIDDLLRARGGQTFTLDHADTLEKLDAQVQGMLNDPSLGRIMNGPVWLSGLSVLDGSVTAEKITVNTIEAITANTGNINVTGNLTAAASYPALSGARIVLNSSELAGYNASNNKTFSLNVDGSGFLGIGSSQITWNTAGAVTVPAAAIGALTIADIGSGTFNSNFDAGTGRVRAGTALQRVELTSAGLNAYNTGGTNTFNLSASTGALTHTGTYTIRNASTGARVEISSVGIRAYNSSNVQTFELLTSNGGGFIGSSPAITFSAGSLSLPGGSLTAGTVTADKLNVSTLSAISANMGTITAGTISAGTVNASTITTGSLNGGLLSSSSVGDAAIGSVGFNKVTTATMTSQTFTVVRAGRLRTRTGTSGTPTASSSSRPGHSATASNGKRADLTSGRSHLFSRRST